VGRAGASADQGASEPSMAWGVDFNEFAREWSRAHERFAAQIWACFRRRLMPEYAETPFPLAARQFSEPIKSDKGY
jgi:peptidyl-prolyl cis-trans isomerase C